MPALSVVEGSDEPCNVQQTLSMLQSMTPPPPSPIPPPPPGGMQPGDDHAGSKAHRARSLPVARRAWFGNVLTQGIELRMLYDVALIHLFVDALNALELFQCSSTSDALVPVHS